ncbi:MAG: thioredoxin family protein [Phycisphaeraceae bacterium]|nr:thioredoxin family protein [Phycisphaeraceae bacterium]
MTRRRGLRSVAALVVLLVLGGRARATAEVFSGVSLDEAVQKAGEKELVVVDFMATWCGPCQAMERDTWVDPRVVKWIKKHAVAVQVIFDEPGNVELSRKYQINAVPTLVVLREGKEFDRSVGYLSPEELIAWLKGVREGKHRNELLIEQSAKMQKSTDAMARYELAGELMRVRQDEQATEQYVWLWEHMLEYEPNMVGVRVSFMAMEMRELASRYGPARQRFVEMRDALTRQLRENAHDATMVGDWLVLNKVVNQSAMSMAWFNRVKRQAEGRELIGRVGFHIEDLLRERGQWEYLALIYPDPLATIKSRAMILRSDVTDEDASESDRQEMSEYFRSSFRDTVAVRYAAYLAAGRDEMAERIAETGLQELDVDGMRLALVRTALEAKQPREGHRQWLAQVKGESEDRDALMKLLDEALMKQAQAQPATRPAASGM